MSTDDKALKRVQGDRAVVNEAMQVQPVDLDDIEVVDADNARKFVSPAAVERMAEDIRGRGLIYPLLVERTPDGRKPFKLWGGFTRYKALKLIAKQDAEEVGKDADIPPVLAACRVYTFAGSTVEEKRQEAFFLNLRENLLRTELSTYDVAERCHYIRDTYGLKANDIRKQLSIDGMRDMSKDYINNLIRMYADLHPSIREVWADRSHPQNGLLTVNYVQKLVAEEYPEQLAMWEGLTANKPGEGGEAGAGDGSNGHGKGKQDKDKVRRASVDTLDAALKAVKDSDASPDYKKGATHALMLAKGDAVTIPGIFDPTAKAKAKREAKAAKGGKAGKGGKASTKKTGKAVKGGAGARAEA